MCNVVSSVLPFKLRFTVSKFFITLSNKYNSFKLFGIGSLNAGRALLDKSNFPKFVYCNNPFVKVIALRILFKEISILQIEVGGVLGYVIVVCGNELFPPILIFPSLELVEKSKFKLSILV